MDNIKVLLTDVGCEDGRFYYSSSALLTTKRLTSIKKGKSPFIRFYPWHCNSVCSWVMTFFRSVGIDIL